MSNTVYSKRVYGLGLGLRSRPSAMTQIPGKSFSPQYPKLLHGPLNLMWSERKGKKLIRILVYKCYLVYYFLIRSCIKRRYVTSDSMYFHEYAKTWYFLFK